jgi:hypothetical protein
MGRTSRMTSLFAVSILACGIGLGLSSPISAQAQAEDAVTVQEEDEAVPASASTSPRIFSVAPAVVRTLEDMQHDEATQGQAAAAAEVIPFRPTMDAAEYQAAKAAAELDPMSVKPGASAP